jgi:hypothetical protein
MGALVNSLGFNIIMWEISSHLERKKIWTLVHECEKVVHVQLILPSFSIPISCINMRPFLSLIGGRMLHHQRMGRFLNSCLD